MRKKVIYFIIGWQVIVLFVYGAGIAVDVYEILGIPWNSLGWKKLVGSIVTILFLETPSIIAGICLLLARKD